jgi:hypothetical protein
VPGEATTYEIEVTNPERSARWVARATLDGVALALEEGAAVVPLAHDGKTHSVEVELGPAPEALAHSVESGAGTARSAAVRGNA